MGRPTLDERVIAHRDSSVKDLLKECRRRGVQFQGHLAEKVCTDPHVNIAFRTQNIRWDTTIPEFVETIIDDAHRVEFLAYYIEMWGDTITHWQRLFVRYDAQQKLTHDILHPQRRVTEEASA